jgi:hypothetical protein
MHLKPLVFQTFKRGVFAPLLLFCTFLSAPAFGDTLCVSGSLSTLIGTTCDNGLLQFTLARWSANTVFSGTDFEPGLSSTDVTFTPVANGFTLSATPQSVIWSNRSVEEFGLLSYTVVALSGQLGGESESDNGLSATGHFDSESQLLSQTCADPFCSDRFSVFHSVHQASGTVFTTGPISFPPPPGRLFSSGTGSAYAFSIRADGGAGDTASWNGSTTYTYSLVNVPESGSMLLPFGIGLLALVIGRRCSKARG